MFQDVWPITDVSVDEANAVAREDGLLCRVVGSLARDASDFDVLAAVVETGSVGEDDGITAKSLTALAPYLTGMTTLEGLEAGVVNGRSVEDTLRLGGTLLASIEAFRSLS
jgi:hypothetical protein